MSLLNELCYVVTIDLILESLQFQHGHLDVCLPLSLIGDSPEVELPSQCSLAVTLLLNAWLWSVTVTAGLCILHL